jgi:thiamine-phosphate diphosphorylase
VRIKNYCHVCGTGLTKKLIQDHERLFCPKCQYPVYENPIPATAAVVINEDHEVLLVKRTVEPKAGQWCLPGGFVEMGEAPEFACLRELKEETGLDGEIHQWAGNIISESPVYQWVIVMGYSIKNVRGRLTAGDDCSEAVFFNPGTMPPIAFRSHREILRNVLKANQKFLQGNESVGQWVSGSVKQMTYEVTPNEKFLQGVQGNAQSAKRRAQSKNTIHAVRKAPCAMRLPPGAYVITSGNHIEIAKRACSAGAGILQYREKHAGRREMAATAQKIREITKKYGTLFIVNDFIDIALIVEADGVHLGQDDIPIAEARKIVPAGFLIGRSTHSLEQAIEAEKQGADYIGSGPVFATPTKEDYIPIGIDTVKQVIETVRIPVVAIGGLNLDNISELQKIGVKNFAMVRAFQKNTEEVVRRINQMKPRA